MKEQGIDMADRFGYDPGALEAAQHDQWFMDNTEPHPGRLYQPVSRLKS